MNKNKWGFTPAQLSIRFSDSYAVRALMAVFMCAGLLVAMQTMAGTFPAELELSVLQSANGGDGSMGTVFNGIVADDRSGTVAAAGDINGDGIEDVFVGAPQAAPGGNFRAGEAYVVFGVAGGFTAEFDLSSLQPANGGDGSAGFVVTGIDPGDATGMSLNDSVDVNGDGIDDLVIGADLADPAPNFDAGEVYVIFGRNTGFPAVFDAASLMSANGGDGSEGFVIRGISSGDFAGVVGRGGDFNNDLVDDLLIGAENADPSGRSNAGETYVIFGRDTGFAAEFDLSSLAPAGGGDGSTGFILAGIDMLDESGTSVDNAGDVNDDGIDDIFIGAPEADADGNQFAGEAYVVFGRGTGFPAVFELSTLAAGNGSTGFVLYGETANLLTARSVSGAGDINGDGINDLVLGADLAEDGAGRAYVVFGRNTAFPATIQLSSLRAANGGDGSSGFIAEGIAGGDGAGRVVSKLGDINDDGFDDVAIGAFLASPNGVTVAGSTYAIFGRDTGFPAEMQLSDLLVANGGDGSIGIAIHGINQFDGSGVSISPAGDVNDDGVDDLLIGAAGGDPAGISAAGETFLIYGQQSQPDTDNDGIADIDDNCPGTANADQLDADGDGVGDACDNCQMVSNADQIDTNGDGIGNICDADVTGGGGNEDCFVNFLDLNALKAVFFTNPANPLYDPNMDFDSSNFINFVDLNIMKTYFFSNPGPSALGCN